MEENNIPMTTEECIRQLKECTRQYNQRIRDNQTEHQEEVKGILQRWADANARFKPGDIIGTPDRKKIIRIEKVRGCCNRTDKNTPVYASYLGERLNEDLTKHWVNSPAFLADVDQTLIKIQ